MKPMQKLIILLLLTATAGISGPALTQTLRPDGRLYTLYPPLGFQATQVECNVYLQWQKPQLPNGATPAGLVGYFLYRDGLLRHYFPNGDSLSFYDYNVEFGTTYVYSLTAKYDLTTYGLPGQFGESTPAAPVTQLVNCSVPMPFYEPWDLGNFYFQNWTFLPAQGNWVVNTGQGNPAPAAFFTATPAVQNYDVTMRSVSLPGDPWICANMYLEFDYKLTDLAAGGTEKLIAEYFIDNTWFTALEIKNEGSTGWIHQKIDISAVCGKRFRIGFRAMGFNSVNITSWAVDNIRATPECKGPVACDYTKSGNIVHLFWQHPQCDSIEPFLGYNVYRSQGPAFIAYAKLNAPLIADTEYDDNIPAGYPTSQFRYVITAIHHDPTTLMVLCEAPCDTLEVDLSLGIGSAGRQGIQIFPNPASEFIRILSESPVESCELLNFMGQDIASIPGDKRQEMTIPVAGLPAGIYLVSIKNASGKFLAKFSVRH